MKPLELLARVPVPGGNEELTLYRHDKDYSIRIDYAELMNSRMHGSEDALSEFGCRHLADHPAPRVLIGGMGMGFTAAAALKALPPTGTLVIAELVPGVISWNQEIIGHLAGHPLKDPRVTVREADVRLVMEEEARAFDAILLDVDNGPNYLCCKGNQHLYTREGLKTIYTALRPKGVLAIWSAGRDREFSHKLGRAGFSVEEIDVRARGRSGGHHMLWLAVKKG